MHCSESEDCGVEPALFGSLQTEFFRLEFRLSVGAYRLAMISLVDNTFRGTIHTGGRRVDELLDAESYGTLYDFSAAIDINIEGKFSALEGKGAFVIPAKSTTISTSRNAFFRSSSF